MPEKFERPLFAAGEERINSFMYLEVTPERLRFRAVGADGRTLDEGTLALVQTGVESN